MKEEAIIGCILGTMVGDAIGLPYEALSLEKQRKLTQNPLKHRLIFGHGMMSDDSEHTVMVAQALIVSGGNERIFAYTLKWQLMLWLLTFPAGIGWATLRAIVKLWLGFSPYKSGVYSAGNGPAMRSSLIGVCYGNNPEKMCNLVAICTRITHTDIKAEYGAVAVAIASYLSFQQITITPAIYYQKLEEIIPEAEEFLTLIKLACKSAEKGENSLEFATQIISHNKPNYQAKFRGISGYIYHTIPVVIQVWLKHPEDYEKAIVEIIKLGGDTDTTAAILGAIIGSRVGAKSIPKNWLDNLWLYPINIPWIKKLGQRLTDVITTNKSQKYLAFSFLGIVLKNIFFFFIVVAHIFWRLFI